MHIPLQMATGKDNYTYIHVGGEFRKYELGVPIIFDGTQEHFVFNESDEDRIIIHIDFSRKHYQPGESK
jgi:hypothetical protein